MIDLNQLTLIAMQAAIEAGNKIIEIYNSDDFSVSTKEDTSPLTRADLASNKIILDLLVKTNIPILSEEESETDYSIRKKWIYFWLVDPLDGTKEFIKKNGEFTVNIALIENQLPIAGVVYIPVSGLLYFSNKNIGSYKIKTDDHRIIVRQLEEYIEFGEKLTCKKKTNSYTVLGSRTHMNAETHEFIEILREKHEKIEIISKGSALKLCYIAEGIADIYPRFGPTMEWDTAAGHSVIKYAGGKVYLINQTNELTYNKENLVNPFFIAERSDRTDK